MTDSKAPSGIAGLAMVLSLGLLLVASAANRVPGAVAFEGVDDRPGRTLAGPSPRPTEGSSTASRSALAEREVLGFLPYWELPDDGDIDLDPLTTLAWFGVEAGRDGRLVRAMADGDPTPGWAGWSSRAFDELLGRAELAGVRVVLTVERFAWDRSGRRATMALLGDPAARATLVADIVETIGARGVHGVNLDFEPLPRAARAGFVRLVRALRSALDRVDPSLQLTFDLTPDVTSYPVRRLLAADAAHAAVLMAYEYRTADSRVAGSVAPLDDPEGLDVRDSLARTLARAPADRVILALPWYGRAWSTRTDATGAWTRRGDRFIEPSTTLYRSAVARAAVAGRRYDREQASAWSAYRARATSESPQGWRQLWYDDPDSIRAKVGLARRKALRGVGIWALGYEGDRQELRAALRYALERPEDGSPPEGEASIAAESILVWQDELPVVGATMRVDLWASDGLDGSGVAFVRLATSGRRDADGSLRTGTTFPAVDSVRISLPHADPVDEVFIPGGSDPGSPAPAASPAPRAVLDAGAVGDPADAIVTLRVQWRDIAGNWSDPVRLRVLQRTTWASEARASSLPDV